MVIVLLVLAVISAFSTIIKADGNSELTDFTAFVIYFCTAMICVKLDALKAKDSDT